MTWFCEPQFKGEQFARQIVFNDFVKFYVAVLQYNESRRYNVANFYRRESEIRIFENSYVAVYERIENLRKYFVSKNIFFFLHIASVFLSRII